MANNPIKGSDFYKDDGALDRLIANLEKVLQTFTTMASGVEDKAVKLSSSLGKLNSSTSSQRNQTKEAAIEAENLKNQHIELEKKIEETTKEIINLKAAQSAKNRVTRLETKLNQASEGSYDKLSAQYSLNKIRLNQMSKAQRETTKSGKLLEKQTKDIFEEMNRLQKATGKSSLQVGRYELANKNLAGSLRNVGAALGFSGVLFATVSIFKSAAKAVREFDKEMVNLGAILGEDREDLEELELEIRRVASTSINTANDVAKLATTLVTLGKTKTEILDLLEPVNNLSIALQAPADAAGELLVQTLNAFGESSEAADRYADVIAKMRTSTALDFERIKIALGFLAPTAKAAGLSIERTGAILGTLVDSGIKAQRAGRLMSSSFLKLADDGKTLEEGLQEIRNVQATATSETEVLTVASSILGKESAALGLILAENTEKVDAYTTSFENAKGSLEALTEGQLKSMDAQIKILDSAWTEFILTVENGEGVLGSFARAGVKAATSMVNLATKATNLFKQETPFEKGEKFARSFSEALTDTSGSIDFYNKLLNQATEEVKAFEAVNLSEQGTVTAANALEYRNLRDRVEELNGTLSILSKREQELKALNITESLKSQKEGTEKLALTQAELNKQAKIRIDLLKSALQEEIDILKARILNSEEFSREKLDLEVKLVRKEQELHRLKGKNILLSESEQNQSIFQLNKKRVDSLLRLEEKAREDNLELLERRIEDQKALDISRIALTNVSENEKTKLTLEAEKKRLTAVLNLNRFMGKKISEEQIETTKNTIQALENEINAVGERTGDRDIYDVLGIRVSDEAKSSITNSLDVIKNSILSLAQTQVSAANTAVEASNQRLENARANLEEQIALREAGEKSDVEGAIKLLNEKQKVNQKALNAQRKAQKNQQRLQEAESAASIITASANILKGFSSIPFIGQVLGVAAVGAMIASFIAAKAQARKVSSFGKGGDFDIKGGSHASGNDVSLGIHGGIERRVEGGEKAAVFSRKAVKTYGGSNISEIVRSINKGVFEKKYANSFNQTDSIVEIITGKSNNSDLLQENIKLREELKETVKSIPQPIQIWDHKGFRRHERVGNTTYLDVQKDNSYG